MFMKTLAFSVTPELTWPLETTMIDMVDALSIFEVVF